MLFLIPMHHDLLSLVGRPYRYENSPGVDPHSEASNCQQSIHLAYLHRLGITIPSGMWSKEIHDDETFIFQTVTQLKYEGDIAIFGPTNQSNARLFHLTYYLGEGNLLHANIVDKQVSVWPLAKFLQTPRYAELKRVKRLQPHLFNTQVLPIISKSC